MASDEQLDWVPPTSEWVAENADAASRSWPSQRARAFEHDPKKQARVSGARQGLMETIDAAHRPPASSAGR